MKDDLTRDEEFEENEQQEDETDLVVKEEDFDDLLVAPSDWTVGSLHQQIGNQIDLDPDFQRRSVWNPKAKSEFIESIFLNIPIPQILLASHKNKRNAFIVLDGKQRLLTIKQFVDGTYDGKRKFKLSKLRILTNLNNKSWSDISKIPEWKDRFLNTTQRTTVLRGWKSEPALYEIFYRLNSGSVKLSPMELRMSLYPGEFLKLLINWSEKIGPIHKVLNLKGPDKRMADVELAARFIAFKERNIPYEGNLKLFIDNTCKYYNEQFSEGNTKQFISDMIENMEQAIEVAMTEFGDHVCRKWKDGKFDSRFNRAVFDVIVGALSDRQVRDWVNANVGVMRGAFVDLSSEDPKFVNSVESTTKSIEATTYRFNAWYDRIKRASGIDLEAPLIG